MLKVESMRSKGEVSEGAILAYCLKAGYTVLQPFGYSHRYDFVLDTGSQLLKVQCKTARRVGQVLRFNACSTNCVTLKRNHYRGQVDFFAVYDPIDGGVYLVRPELVGMTDGSLRLTTPKSSQKKRLKMAADFEMAKVISEL